MFIFKRKALHLNVRVVKDQTTAFHQKAIFMRHLAQSSLMVAMATSSKCGILYIGFITNVSRWLAYTQAQCSL